MDLLFQLVCGGNWGNLLDIMLKGDAEGVARVVALLVAFAEIAAIRTNLVGSRSIKFWARLEHRWRCRSSCAGDAPLGRFVGGFHVRVLAAVSWGWGLETVGRGAFGDTVRVPFRVGLSCRCSHLLLWCQELTVDAIRQVVDLSMMRLYDRRRCLPLFCLRGSYCVLGGGDLRRTGIGGPVRHFNISIP